MYYSSRRIPLRNFAAKWWVAIPRPWKMLSHMFRKAVVPDFLLKSLDAVYSMQE